MILNWIITHYQWLWHVLNKKDFIILNTFPLPIQIHLYQHKFDAILK